MPDEVDGNIRVDSLTNGKRGKVNESADLIMKNSLNISNKSGKDVCTLVF